MSKIKKYSKKRTSRKTFRKSKRKSYRRRNSRKSRRYRGSGFVGSKHAREESSSIPPAIPFIQENPEYNPPDIIDYTDSIDSGTNGTASSSYSNISTFSNGSSDENTRNKMDEINKAFKLNETPLEHYVHAILNHQGYKEGINPALDEKYRKRYNDLPTKPVFYPS